MKNLKNTLFVFSFVFLISFLLFPSCKPKRIVSQPIEQAAIKEEAPKRVVDADSDGDGIPDSKDNCPNKAGTVANGGCPELPKEEAKPSFNYKNILFEFNSSVLKTSSYSVLDDIAREMKNDIVAAEKFAMAQFKNIFGAWPNSQTTFLQASVSGVEPRKPVRGKVTANLIAYRHMLKKVGRR
jgi:hypothetical protein